MGEMLDLNRKNCLLRAMTDDKTVDSSWKWQLDECESILFLQPKHTKQILNYKGSFDETQASWELLRILKEGDTASLKIRTQKLNNSILRRIVYEDWD